MAIFTKKLFDNPYIDLGKDNDVCVLCRKECAQKDREAADYQIDRMLFGKLSGKRIFKLFQNSNTPFVLCQEHLENIVAEMQEEES